MAAPLRPQAPDAAPEYAPMTLEQFLEWEEEQERRHEFVDGFPRAMTGGTLRHSTIAANILSVLLRAARRSGCSAHVSDVQVRTPSGRVYYPDVTVRCGPFVQTDTHARTPCMIVEVTSRSTRGTDLGTKQDDYREVPSLRAYIVAEQIERRLHVHVRRDDGTWTEWEASDAAGVAEVAPPCVDAVLTLGEIYEDTGVLPPPDVRAYAAPTDNEEPTA